MNLRKNLAFCRKIPAFAEKSGMNTGWWWHACHTTMIKQLGWPRGPRMDLMASCAERYILDLRFSDGNERLTYIMLAGWLADQQEMDTIFCETSQAVCMSQEMAARGAYCVWSPKDCFFPKKRQICFIKMQESFSISLQYARGHPATFRGDLQPSAGSRAVISSREQSRWVECASHGARLQRPGPQNGPALWFQVEHKYACAYKTI